MISIRMIFCWSDQFLNARGACTLGWTARETTHGASTVGVQARIVREQNDSLWYMLIWGEFRLEKWEAEKGSLLIRGIDVCFQKQKAERRLTSSDPFSSSATDRLADLLLERSALPIKARADAIHLATAAAAGVEYLLT
jgi:hypothetical protein